MALFSNLFKRTEEAPRPALAALLSERALPADLPGLVELARDFEHFKTVERVAFADAIAEVHGAGQDLPEPWKFAQYDVLPELVPHWQGERDPFFHRPFCEGLTLRVRLGDRRLTKAWPALFEVSLDDILDQALHNLREKAKTATFERLPSGIYRSTFQDPHIGASSLILLPEFWGNIFPGQNHFVAVPNDSTLLVAPQVLLPKLVEAATKALETGKPMLLATLLQHIEKKLVTANLQDPHPIAQPQRELRQMDLLEALRAQDGDLDPAQAGPIQLGTLRNNQNRTSSYATWIEGGPVALPEVDLVAFVSAAGDPLGIYFRPTLPRIHEIKGVALELWGPRRLRYETFPNAEQLSRLEVFATAEQMKAMVQEGQKSSSSSSSSGSPGSPGSRSSQGGPRPTPPTAAAAPNAPGLQGASPIPAHLRNAGLGIQNKD